MPDDLEISSGLCVPLSEIEFTAVRASGPGGQHVNKTSSAVQLRFDIRSSSLPYPVKARLLARSDGRLTLGGVLILQVQDSRSQARNRAIALERLAAIIRAAAKPPKVRRKTKPTKASIQRRLEKKSRRSDLKGSRGKPRDFD